MRRSLPMGVACLRTVLAVPIVVAAVGACGGGAQSPTDASGHPDSSDGRDVSVHDDAGSDGTFVGNDSSGAAADGGASVDVEAVTEGGRGADVDAATNEGGSGDAAAVTSEAGGGDASFGPPTTWVFNIVNSTYVNTVQNVVSGAAGDLKPMTNEFYRSFADNFDFIYLIAEVPASTGNLSVMVRWDGTPGVGIGAAFDDPTWGSAARLKQVVAFGTLVNGVPYESGPTLHETFHHWSMYLDASFGFDTATGHWGRSSADGLHGGFNRDTVVCRDNGQKPTGSVPACPLNASQRMNISTAPFSPCCVADIKPYSAIELYLLGLVPSSQVLPLWVMDNPVYGGPVWADGGGNIVAMNYDITSFHVVAVNDIIAKEGARPAATQTDFRAAFVLVTSAAATADQLGRIARWARRLSGEEVDPTTGVISFGKATGGLATMTTRLQ